jgi:hypothetical protein
MKAVLGALFLIFLIADISAVIISEVEINPAEGRLGREWIELYNDDNIETDISGWMIYDGLASPAKRYTVPEGTTVKSREYFVVELSSATILNNNGDFVTLYDASQNKIDETDTLKEATSSTNTWQFCSSWELKEQTKGKENGCEEKIDEEEINESVEEEQESGLEENKDGSNESDDEETGSNLVDKNEGEKAELTPIKLNSQTLKSEKDSGSSSKNTYALYGFGFFCILLVFLFMLRKRKITELQ